MGPVWEIYLFNLNYHVYRMRGIGLSRIISTVNKTKAVLNAQLAMDSTLIATARSMQRDNNEIQDEWGRLSARWKLESAGRYVPGQ